VPPATEQRAVCMGDAIILCSSAIPNKERIAACLASKCPGSRLGAEGSSLRADVTFVSYGWRAVGQFDPLPNFLRYTKSFSVEVPTGQILAYVYFRGQHRPALGDEGLTPRHEARRIISVNAKLPRLFDRGETEDRTRLTATKIPQKQGKFRLAKKKRRTMRGIGDLHFLVVDAKRRSLRIVWKLKSTGNVRCDGHHKCLE
jgi:hypothetical protein